MDKFLKGSLTKVLKNDLYKRVVKHNVQPYLIESEERDFDFSDLPTTMSSIFKTDGNEFFAISITTDGYKVEFFPDDKMSVVILEYEAWETVTHNFEIWIKAIKGSANEPDLWANLKKYRPSGDISEISANEKNHFTYEQVEQLKITFDEIKKQITSEFNLNKKQEKQLSENIDYLVEAAKRQNMRDWRNLCIGTFMGLAMNLAITPDKINRFWQIINDGFGIVRHFLGY